MSVDSVSSTSLVNRLEAFRSGETTLSKADLEEMNANSTGSGKASELLQILQDNYDTVDINGDGISLDELQTYAKDGGIGTPPPGGPRGPGGGEPPSMTKEDLVAMKERAAEEGVEEPEGIDTLIENFDTYDSDQDGSISGEEFKAFADEQGIAPPPPPPMPEQVSSEGTSTSTSLEDENSLATRLVDMILRQYSNINGTDTDALSVLSEVKA